MSAGAPSPLDRAAVTMGLASVFSAVFAVLDGGVLRLVEMTGGTAVVAVVLGALAAAAGHLRTAALVMAGGAAFCLAALTVLLELATGAHWLGGSASTFSLWLGLGAGLLAVGNAARNTSTRGDT